MISSLFSLVGRHCMYNDQAATLEEKRRRQVDAANAAMENAAALARGPVSAANVGLNCRDM